MSPVPVAVADVGSATVHLLVAHLRPDGALTPLHEESVRLLLGGRAVPSGVIPPDAEADALAVLMRFRDVADRFQVERLLVVATAVVRSAVNGEAVIQRLRDRLDLPIGVLSPEQEVRLAALGAFAGTLPSTGLFADSGGGSTQVAYITAGVLAWERSLPLGASTLTSLHLHHDAPTAAEVASATAAVETAIASLPSSPELGSTIPVITGGTATVLGAFGIGGCPTGHLTPRCLATAEELSRVQSSVALATRYGLFPPRARILFGGCLIVRRLLDWCGAPLWRISNAGLREGVLRAWAADPEHWLQHEPQRAGARQERFG